MKCFKCGKNFDYEKFYGICPKCGCYNKRETPKEQHEQLHNLYDGGYTHSVREGQGEPYGGPAYGQPPDGMPGYQGNVVVREVRTNQKGGTKFLIFSIIIFGLVFIGGTVLGIIYQSVQEEKVQRQILEAEPPILEHKPQETFACQDLMLRVKEARVLADGSELDLPEGKKLIAVWIEGTGSGSWEDENKLSSMYICCKDTYYRQISSYEFEAYGTIYRCPVLDTYAFMGEEFAEGWVGFLLDEEEEQVTLHIEDRSEENEVQIDGIHRITLELSKGDTNE